MLNHNHQNHSIKTPCGRVICYNRVTSSERRKSQEKMSAFEFEFEFGGEEVVRLLSHPDPVVLEINRLENLLKEKENELRKAQSEIRALRATDVLKDKAVEELVSEVNRLEEKLRSSEKHLEQKSLEIKKLVDEKKGAMAAQYAAEATLRRVYADQKDDDSVSLELVIAPFEAELKMLKNEVSALHEDKKALERLIKSKEAALLEAERILRSALERALVVEEVQNQNFELRRQIEIFHDENKILEKTNRQKVLEVEKLGQTIKELEEAILAGGAVANTIRDYRRQISVLNEEKRTLERELARARVSANRIAAAVANEWKDGNDRVMPVKQWLEERRMLQAEMQKLKDKLAISEKATRAEEQIKEKLKQRLKTLEEGLKSVSNFSTDTNGSSKNEKSSNFFEILLSNSRMIKRSTSQPRASTITKSSMLMMGEKHTPWVAGGTKAINSLKKKNYYGENLLKKSLWASRNKVIENSGKENEEMNKNAMAVDEMENTHEMRELESARACYGTGLDITNIHSEDMVSGFLYDKLQKEVICLRKSCSLKEGYLNSKDEEIKMLIKKVETLSKALEVESKKTKREAAIRERIQH